MVGRVKWQWIYGCGCVLCMLFLAGCGESMSADEMAYLDDEDAVQEFTKEVAMTEQIRSEELKRDDQARATAQARDVGPLNEVVRHRERAKAKDGSTPEVDIGPTSELERHRQSGGCPKCPR